MINRYPEWILTLRKGMLNVFSKYSLPRWVIFAGDNLAVFLVFHLAYLLRYNFSLSELSPVFVFNQALVATVIYAIFGLMFRSSSGLLRHTTLTDIATVFIVTTCSVGALMVLSFMSRLLNLSEIATVSYSVILIHYVAITVFLFFSRVFIKVLFRFASNVGNNKKRVLIYGAGDMGFTVKRVLLSDSKSDFSVWGFIDDNTQLQGKKINGLPVYNPKILSVNYLTKNRIKTLIIAINKLSPSRKSEIIRTALNYDLEILETPAVEKWLNGQLQMRQIKKVQLQDLLNRDTIQLNMDLIAKGLNNKTILVTGAAGSIGSELVRQLARFSAKRIILVDQAETPMYHLENELREKFVNLKYNPILADVTNSRKMELIFKEFQPDIVFHAAAYKHVPLMEQNPHEALRVNVGGTKNVTELSIKYGVSKFVMISTDKSVNPSSVMGASKRICEMFIQSKAKEEGVKTQFVITRFGNVLGSNGSVIPLFTKQIEEGGPVTVTHPDITRYFMTIPEACELVLEAGFMGKSNQIYVFDMGEPVKIEYLAQQMIQLSGLTPGKDIQIIYTGLRPGEKLYEELLTGKEDSLPTHHPKIMVARVEKFDHKMLLARIDMLIKNVYLLSENDVIGLFREIVPEYKSSNGKFNKTKAERSTQRAETGKA
jgi:FlaA1/EpsC-like NDP-sugar epimerase